ncbi:T9SS type A sorting domain-containing protein [Aquimarina algiphila]|uniref:T9SS type A sorting domain-containing protein n=1 Tax=Aquimarina algiphila TaxID=2047982 RepID=UPI00248FF319|nr:T9SS type A sorting domain-containing protein [Aquimarina algiphila]
MKRILTIVFVIFFCSMSFGQQTIIKINEYEYDSYYRDRRCGEELRLRAYYQGGGSDDFLYLTNGQPKAFEGSSTAERTFTLNGIVNRVELYVFSSDARDQVFGDTCDGARVAQDTDDRNVPLNPCSTRVLNVSASNSSDVSVSSRVVVELISLPSIARAPGASNIAGFEDPINIIASPGFNNSVYNWQYGFQTGTVSVLCGILPIRFCDVPTYDWFELPIANTANASVVLEDFLTEDVIGREIFFRIQSCGQEASNLVGYQVRKSAPHITGISTKDVTCYDSIDDSGNGDGSITLTFDRPLDPARDQVNFSVIDLRTNSVVKNDNNITSFGPGNTHTISGLPASAVGFGFRVDVLGFYNGSNYYTEGVDHFRDFNINRPSPVAFVGEPNDDANKVDVWCINGSDGTIDLRAEGGVGGYRYIIRKPGEPWNDNDDTQWIPFSTQFTHTITGLSADTYEIKIRDANKCVAKEQIDVAGEIKLGPEILKTVIIDEPDAPLDFELTLINEPRAFGFEDGRIRARIFGGTAESDDTYRFEWRDAVGTLLTTTITNVLPGDQGYEVILHSIGKGVYSLSAWDANFDSATDKNGCFFINADYNLGEPNPLEVTINIDNPISCHIENEYSDGVDFNAPFGIPDQFQDGALIATVTGGVPFDKTSGNTTGQCRTPFRRYCYRWKKNVGGVWQDIPVNDSIITYQSVGTYALNIEDSNGIVLGRYESFTDTDGSREYRIVEEIDSTRYLPQPDKLGISFTSSVVTCANGDDAQATALVVGGTTPYTYEWSNGETTATIDNLIAGTYIVFVTDGKGCQIEGSIKIEQPNGLEINATTAVSPTCFEGDDGRIEVDITGGNPPYTYKWNTGTESTSINGLSSGTYRIEVIDRKGCKAFYEETLVDPDPVVVNMEDKRSLCGNQSLNLDIAIDDSGAVYSWSSENGFTSSESSVEITESGRYIATITSSLGCIGIGEIDVEVFDVPIDSDFLLTTQAYSKEEVILVNVSEPMGEKVEWTIPEGVEIVSESDEKLVLKFEQEGAYDINLRSFQLDCYEDFTKTILVQPALESPEVFASQGEFIEEFIVYPNPNNGTFQTKISLAEESNIKLKIVNLISGATMDERTEKNNIDFLLDYSLALPTGVYLMLLETPKGSETRKLVFE